jgi:nucleoside-diphosphate-sugar epimerase
LAHELVSHGYRVRVVRRGAPDPTLSGVEWLRGDLTDSRFADQACRGAAAVYNCANPALYHRWDELLVPLSRTIRQAAARAGSKLVVLDNVYMYGIPDAVPFSEDMPLRPCSHKGELRKMLAEELFEAHERGELRATSGRASDFFGPGAGSMSMFGDRLAHQLASGKAVEVFGNPDLPRSYSYVPDVAHGLFVLGTRDEALGRAWHLPVAWQGTTRELLQAIASELGTSARLRVIPDALLRVAGLFQPALGAIREMTYQWKVPFVLDDRRFRTTFGVEATPAAEAVRQSARSLQRLAA